MMLSHEPVDFATASENFASESGCRSLVVKAFLQAVCRAFELVDELVYLIFQIRAVHRVVIEIGIELSNVPVFGE